MAAIGHWQTKYRTPKKGTKTRALLLALLRPEGLPAGQVRTFIKGPLSATAERLYDYGGWDIQSTKVDGILHYHLVGRLRWSGGYRAFRVAQ